MVNTFINNNNKSKMEKKQSSIEWFHNELEHLGNTLGFISKKMLDIHFNTAKAMHKEEVTDAYIDGHSTWGENRNAEQYYNEIFGGQDNE